MDAFQQQAEQEAYYYHTLMDFVTLCEGADVKQIQHDLNELAKQFKVQLHPITDYKIK